MVVITKLIMVGIAIVCSITLAFIVQDFVTDKVNSKSSKKINRVHFYVSREHDGALRLYMCKPIRCEGIFVSCREKGGRCLGRDGDLEMYGINENDYKDLKWEDEPVEVFLNMED